MQPAGTVDQAGEGPRGAREARPRAEKRLRRRRGRSAPRDLSSVRRVRRRREATGEPSPVRDEEGRPVDALRAEGGRALFVGDLVDRGPDSPGVLRLVISMVGAGHALCVPGNHEHKLVKALRGLNVSISHGLETTLEQFAGEDEGSASWSRTSAGAW